MKKLLILLTLFILPATMFGQVAAPSLNPFTPSKLAAVSTWRYASTIGFQQESNKGETESRSTGTDWLQTSDQDQRDSLGLMAFRMDPVTLELSSRSYMENHTLIDGSPDVQIENRNTDVNISYRLQMVSLGLSHKQKTTKTEQNEQVYEEGTTTSRGVSFDWMINEVLFVAAGVDRVSLEETDTTVANEWEQSTFGVAYVSGYPGLELVSFEVYYQYSPESYREAEGLLGESKRYSLETMGGSLGWQKLEYLINISTERRVSDQSDTLLGTSYEQDTIYSNSRVDLGYSPLKGLVFIASATENKQTNSRTISNSTSESTKQNRGYSIGVGFNFP